MSLSGLTRVGQELDKNEININTETGKNPEGDCDQRR